MPRRNDRGRGNARGPRARPTRWDDGSWDDVPAARRRPGRRDGSSRADVRRDREVIAARATPPPPLAFLPSAQPQVATCGRCAEFMADELSGRGECLHPGSGILRPWTDTPGCPFFH